MKTEKTPSHKKLKTVPTAANSLQANKTSASPPKEKAGQSDNHPARLSREERHLAVELAPHWQAERRGFSHDDNEQDWIEAELVIELDQMRKCDSLPSD
jgi:hypothetical protein